MSHRYPRRTFLRGSLSATALGGAALSGDPASRQSQTDEVETDADVIRFGSDLEPIVRLIEETP